MLNEKQRISLTDAAERYSSNLTTQARSYLEGLTEQVQSVTFPHGKNDEDRFNLLTKQVGECIEWTGGKYPGGYGRYYSGGKTRYAHRVSYMAANNVVLTKDNLVCHSCDNPSCVKPDHLWIGTQKDNVHDCISKGRKVNPPINRKVTDEQVAEIKASFVKDVNLKNNSEELAIKYGLTSGTILEIIGGRHRA